MCSISQCLQHCVAYKWHSFDNKCNMYLQYLISEVYYTCKGKKSYGINIVHCHKNKIFSQYVVLLIIWHHHVVSPSCIRLCQVTFYSNLEDFYSFIVVQYLMI